MAITAERQVDLAREALLDLTEGGQEGRMVSHGELAMAYMKRHPSFLRRQKRINEFREFFLLQPSEGPSKPPFRYRHQTSLAIMAMEAEGSIGSVFVDPETGEPLENPTRPLDHRDKRYFPVLEPEEEASPPPPAGPVAAEVRHPLEPPREPRRDPGRYLM
jgi:hypothetical protein